MPATVQPKRRFFSAVLYGTGHADRERPAQEQGGDGQQERAHDHGQDAEFVGIRTPDPAEYLVPPCALNTTGSAKQAMRAKTAHTEAPASHAASRGSPPRSVSEVFIKPSVLRCMERLLGEGGSFWRKGPPSLNCQRSSRPSLPLRRRSFFIEPLMPVFPEEVEGGVGVRFFWGGRRGRQRQCARWPGTTVHQGMNVLRT